MRGVVPPTCIILPLTANVFLEFDRRWREADPPNIMAFAKIYGPLTEDYRRQLIHARGDLDFVSALQGY